MLAHSLVQSAPYPLLYTQENVVLLVNTMTIQVEAVNLASTIVKLALKEQV
jgi:hypothetical protein